MSRGFDVDRSRAVWWVFGAALGVAVLYVLYRFIGTFVFGIFLYYATRPVYKRVRPRVEQRSVAAALSLTLLVLPALLLVGYTVAIAYREFKRFAGNAGAWAQNVDLGNYEKLLNTYIEASRALTNPQELLGGNGVEIVGGALLTSLSYLGILGLFALHLFVIVAIAFYLLRDDDKLSRWFSDRFGDEGGALEEYISVVDNDFNNIFFGNILNAVVTGTIGAIVFTLLNLVAPQDVAIPYAALVGLLTGIASLVPVVGMKIVYVPVGLYLFALPFVNQQPEATWFPVTFAAVAFVVVDTIPDLLLRPYVSGRSLHMGALMLAYVLGPLLFGWYGLFLAPMLLVLVMHFAKVVMPELVNGRPLQPRAVDPTYLQDEAAAGTPGGPGVADRAVAEERTAESGEEWPDRAGTDEVGTEPAGEASQSSDADSTARSTAEADGDARSTADAKGESRPSSDGDDAGSPSSGDGEDATSASEADEDVTSSPEGGEDATRSSDEDG